jgi:hypothetical protein
LTGRLLPSRRGPTSGAARGIHRYESTRSGQKSRDWPAIQRRNLRTATDARRHAAILRLSMLLSELLSAPSGWTTHRQRTYDNRSCLPEHISPSPYGSHPPEVLSGIGRLPPLLPGMAPPCLRTIILYRCMVTASSKKMEKAAVSAMSAQFFSGVGTARSGGLLRKSAGHSAGARARTGASRTCVCILRFKHSVSGARRATDDGAVSAT